MDMRPINDKIIEIWRQYQNDYPEATKLSPMQFHDLPDHVDILFLGINPSFNDTMEPMREIFTFNNFNEENRSRMIEYDSSTVDWVHRDGATPRSLFAKILRLFEQDKNRVFRNLQNPAISIEFLDLFFIRETHQVNMQKTLFARPRQFSDFAKQQLDISMRLIQQLTPKMIVVMNKKAAEFLLERIITEDEDKRYDVEIGTYKSTLNHSLPTPIPIICSGSLTGGYNLDNYSFERLRWHMDWILGKIQNQ